MDPLYAVRDAYITDEKPSTALGTPGIIWPTNPPTGPVESCKTLWVGEGSHGNKCKTLIEFDLSSIPANSNITSARIRLFQYDGLNDWITSSHAIKLQAVLINQEWHSESVTWNNQPTVDTSYKSPETASFYNRISTNVEIDVTDITQHYIENQSNYYGYMIYYTGENSETRKEFRSTNFSDANKRPRLIITYVAATPEIPNTAPIWDDETIWPPISSTQIVETWDNSYRIEWGSAIDLEDDPIYYVLKRSINNTAYDEVFNGAHQSYNHYEDDLTGLYPGDIIRYTVYATDYSKDSKILISGPVMINRYVELNIPYNCSFNYENPGVVEKLIFVNNPSPITNVVYLSFYDDPQWITNFLKIKAENTNASLTIKAESLQSQLNDIGNSITQSYSKLETCLTNKSNYISTFERDNYQFIKEGLWNEKDYVLKKLKTTIQNPELSLSATSEEGFFIPFGATEIDLASIRIWLHWSESEPRTVDAYVYEYQPYIDYEIEYGSYNGQFGIFIRPLVGIDDTGAFKYNVFEIGSDYDTRLSEVEELYVEYRDLSGNIISSSSMIEPYFMLKEPLLKVTADYYARTYNITDFNPQLSSLEIVTQIDRDPLIENTDFTYTINGDKSGTITFKPSQNALHLLNYYSISYYNNVTVKSFYADAEDALMKLAYPSVSYEVSIVDLSSLPGFEDFIPVVGKRILINDSVLKLNGIYCFISEISYDLDNPENTKITITNYENIGKTQQILDNGGGF